MTGEPVSQSPILSTSFHTHPDVVGFSANDLQEDAPHFYTRWSNPTLQTLETRLAALDGGETAVTFASGMLAITALFFDRLNADDHPVLPDVCYAGVAELAHDMAAVPRTLHMRCGLSISTAQFSRATSLCFAGTRMIF